MRKKKKNFGTASGVKQKKLEIIFLITFKNIILADYNNPLGHNLQLYRNSHIIP